MKPNHTPFIAFLWLLLIVGIFYTELAFGSTVQLASNGTFVFNPRTHQYYAINPNGTVVKQGRASGGRSYCPDIRRSCRTPSGVYHVMSKGGSSCRSSRYPVGHGGAPMPYCMFFSKYYAVHGSYDVPNYNASHGCIRVRPSEAYWLNRNFIRVGTKVVVKPY
ncbi:MAG: L,D-transpeptidase [Gammaproteobacteria bacterium]|nr:L,D-transpeptidase [Gammaproteobacteria bacterium]